MHDNEGDNYVLPDKALRDSDLNKGYKSKDVSSFVPPSR